MGNLNQSSKKIRIWVASLIGLAWTGRCTIVLCYIHLMIMKPALDDVQPFFLYCIYQSVFICDTTAPIA